MCARVGVRVCAPVCMSMARACVCVHPCVCAQVESYVEHIRGLLEERELLTAEYERDNEQLRLELQQSRLLQGSAPPAPPAAG